MARRALLDQFQLPNIGYVGCTVTFYTADAAGAATATKATLYDDLTGSGTLLNPQSFNSEGALPQPTYIDVAVVPVVAGAHVVSQTLGVVCPPGGARGDWATLTLYLPGDIITDGAAGTNTGDVYAVVNFHESGVWATDSVNANKMKKILDESDLVADVAAFGLLTQANNLSDLANKTTALANLGLPVFPSGTTTATIQAAIDAAVTAGGGIVQLPAEDNIILSASLTHNSAVPVIIQGTGPRNTILKTAGAITSLLSLGASSVGVLVRDVGFDTTGQNVACVSITAGAQQATFIDCGFSGNRTGDLVVSRGQFITFERPVAIGNATGTIPFHFDGYNQNSQINDGRIGGICNTGILINNATNGGTTNRPEGVKITNTEVVNTGSASILIGSSLYVAILGCILDQSANYGVFCDTSADKIQVHDCFLGAAAAATTWVGFYRVAAAGNNFSAIGNVFYGGGQGIASIATVGNYCNGFIIANNQFVNFGLNALYLDSVMGCVVTGNVDSGTPVNGSWLTVSTNAVNGSYRFDNNSWHTTTPATYSSTATYLWGNDTGIVMRKRGLNTASASTSLVVTHGLSRTPTKIFVTPQSATAGAFFVDTIGATTFKINWATSGSQPWSWEAEV